MKNPSRPKPPKNMAGKTTPDKIRPGQRKPYKKATQKQVQDRIEWLALTLAIQPSLKDHEITSLMRERYGIEYRQTGEYITRAKRLLLDQANIDKKQAKEIHLKALLDTIKNGKANERNAALRLWADVFGLDAAKQMRHAGADGKPLAPVVVAPQVIFTIPDNGREKGKA